MCLWRVCLIFGLLHDRGLFHERPTKQIDVHKCSSSNVQFSRPMISYPYCNTGGGYIWLSTALLNCMSGECSYISTILGHKMSVSGVTSDCKLASQLDSSKYTYASTREVHLTVLCLLNCSLQNVKMTLCSTGLDHQMPLPREAYICIWNLELISVLCFASQRSFLQKTNNPIVTTGGCMRMLSSY